MRDGGRGGKGKCYSKYRSTALALSLPLYFFFFFPRSHLTLDFVPHRKYLSSHSNQLENNAINQSDRFHTELSVSSVILQHHGASVSLPSACVFAVECHLTKASPPATTLNYPPVTEADVQRSSLQAAGRHRRRHAGRRSPLRLLETSAAEEESSPCLCLMC